MPTISTGNPGWDQNLSTLGNALFPDPSKQAQGYYYGSQARKEQLESNKIIDQQNWRNDYGMYSRGLPVAPPVWQQPDNVPGAAPIRAAPTNLPYSAAAAAATPSLANTIAGMTPQQAADHVPAAVAPMTVGTPPPYSSPSASAPPAPNTTTSNGQVPQNDLGSGPLHPASINTTGGGTPQAPPATANGSPAPVPPGMTLPGLLAMHGAGALAGIDAATLAGGGQALAYELFNRKIITENQYKQMLAGTGATQPMVADIGAASAANVAGINAGSAANVANINERGQTTRKGMETKFIVTEPSTGAGIEVPLSQLQGLGGRPSFAPEAVTQGVKPIDVQPGGPGTQPTVMSTGAAIKGNVPTYQKGTEDIRQTQRGKIDTYINPNDPTQEKTMEAGDAARNGWVEKPKNDNEVIGIIDKAIQRETDPAKLQALRDKKAMIGPAPKPPDAEEVQKREFQTDTALEKLFPIPSNAPFSNTMPAGASPELGPLLTDLTNQYFTESTDRAVRGNPVQAANKALEQMLRQKFINPEQVRHRFGSAILKPAYDKAGNPIEPQERFRVDLIDPNSPDKKPFAPGKAPSRIPMERPLSSAIVPPAAGSAPAATAAPTATPNLAPSAPPPVIGGRPGGGSAPRVPPGTPVGLAPGQPDGATGTIQQTGQTYVVRGGQGYAQ